MQEGITQEPARSKTEQELEQRAVPGRVGFHWDEKEHEEWGCRDQHCGPQCVGPEGDSVQVVLGAWSRSLPRGYVAMFVAMSSVVVAIVGVAMAVAMVQIPM